MKSSTEMKLSRLANRIKQSQTRELFDLAQKISDVIDLTLGDPDIPPPLRIRDAACLAINEGKTRYSQNAGLIELRNTIANSINDEYRLNISANNVMVTVGGMEAIYLALLALVNPRDEVLIPSPCWVNYEQITMLCRGRPIMIPTQEQHGFVPSIDDFEQKITNRTKVIILNSPNNPTGVVYPSSLLKGVERLAEKYDLSILSDEVYRDLIFDSSGHNSPIDFDKSLKHTILIDSISKSFCMTGWRCGCAIAENSIVRAMSKLQENIAACAPLPSQHAAIEAYKNNCNRKTHLSEFEKRRNLLLQEIETIPLLSCRRIPSTFYAFVNIRKTKLPSRTFALQLLQAAHVAVVPGITYGPQYDGYIRIAFTQSLGKIKEACSRIRKFTSELN